MTVFDNQEPVVSNKVVAPVTGIANPPITFGDPEDGTGISGAINEINFSLGGERAMKMGAGGVDFTPAAEYSGSSSNQAVAADLEVAATVGDNTDTSFIAAGMFNLIGDALTKTKNYLAGVIGAYSLTGSNGSTYQKGGVLGIIMDGVSVADGAVVAVLDGDSSQTNANAAFAARGNNSVPNSGFDYGLDLYSAAHDGYPVLPILKADIRCSNQVVIMNGAGAPVDGTTGDNFAGPGSLYLDITNGVIYIQTSLITTPVWVLVESGNSVLAQPLTGYSSSAGTLASTDTVLVGFNKLNGNADAIKVTADAALPSASFTDAAVNAKLLTGLAAGSATPISASDSILVALANLQAQIDAI